MTPNQVDIGAYGYLLSLALLVYALCLDKGWRRPEGTVVSVVIVLIAVVMILSLWRPKLLEKIIGNYTILLILGVTGMILGMSRRLGQHWVLAAIYLSGIMIAGIIIPQHRQRFVLDGILCVYACFTIDYLCRLIERKLAGGRRTPS